MSRLDELQEEIRKLQAEAEQLIAAEKGNAIEEVKIKIKSFGLTAADLGLVIAAPAPTYAKAPSKARKPVSQAIAEASNGTEAKYKGPNGEVWVRKAGRPPAWVTTITKAGGNIEDYRVKDAEAP